MTPAELAELARLCGEVHEERMPVHSMEFWTGSVNWIVTPDGTLCLSGSNSLNDWLINLHCWPTRSPTGPGWVHSGFLKVVREIWETLKMTVLHRRRVKRVCGYSLGGALAVLVAEKLEGVETITFSCPRIGSWAWARRYPHASTHYRVTPDLICLMPPWYRLPHLGQVNPRSGGWNCIQNHLQGLSGWNDPPR